jgi:hypothetical protein
MQFGKCVRDVLRNLILLLSGRMSHTLTLIMKAAGSTETSVHMYWTTGGHILGESNPHIRIWHTKLVIQIKAKIVFGMSLYGWQCYVLI